MTVYSTASQQGRQKFINDWTHWNEEASSVVKQAVTRLEELRNIILEYADYDLKDLEYNCSQFRFNLLTELLGERCLFKFLNLNVKNEVDSLHDETIERYRPKGASCKEEWIQCFVYNIATEELGAYSIGPDGDQTLSFLYNAASKEPRQLGKPAEKGPILKLFTPQKNELWRIFPSRYFSGGVITENFGGWDAYLRSTPWSDWGNSPSMKEVQEWIRRTSSDVLKVLFVEGKDFVEVYFSLPLIHCRSKEDLRWNQIAHPYFRLKTDSGEFFCVFMYHCVRYGSSLSHAKLCLAPLEGGGGWVASTPRLYESMNIVSFSYHTTVYAIHGETIPFSVSSYLFYDQIFRQYKLCTWEDWAVLGEKVFPKNETAPSDCCVIN